MIFWRYILNGYRKAAILLILLFSVLVFLVAVSLLIVYPFWYLAINLQAVFNTVAMLFFILLITKSLISRVITLIRGRRSGGGKINNFLLIKSALTLALLVDTLILIRLFLLNLWLYFAIALIPFILILGFVLFVPNLSKQ